MAYHLQIRAYFCPTLDVSACTETTLKTAIMVYGEDQVGVSFLKVFCTILCEARLKDKLAYLFKDFASGKTFLFILDQMIVKCLCAFFIFS